MRARQATEVRPRVKLVVPIDQVPQALKHRYHNGGMYETLYGVVEYGGQPVMVGLFRNHRAPPSVGYEVAGVTHLSHNLLLNAEVLTALRQGGFLDVCAPRDDEEHERLVRMLMGSA